MIRHLPLATALAVLAGCGESEDDARHGEQLLVPEALLAPRLAWLRAQRGTGDD